eukprot:12144846-Alexandrium_andersonii.AAC.1
MSSLWGRPIGALPHSGGCQPTVVAPHPGVGRAIVWHAPGEVRGGGRAGEPLESWTSQGREPSSSRVRAVCGAQSSVLSRTPAR